MNVEEINSIIDRGLKAQQFLESEFYQKYLLPYLDGERFKAYPKPDTDGWQEKYRYARAVDDSYTQLMQTIMNWTTEKQLAQESLKVGEKDAIDA